MRRNWFEKPEEKKIILASKVAEAPMNWFRGNWTLLDRENIKSAIDSSLKRLQTDYIDLYQLHWPDRRMSMFGADGLGYKHCRLKQFQYESIDISELVDSGKIRYIGLSNETPWGLSEFIKFSEMYDLPRVINSEYLQFLNRSYEIGMSEFHHRSQVRSSSLFSISTRLFDRKVYRWC